MEGKDGQAALRRRVEHLLGRKVRRRAVMGAGALRLLANLLHFHLD